MVFIDSAVIFGCHKFPCDGETLTATINDVAQKAGVSIKTVSRVVNNENGVSKKTRDLIQQVIHELGYVPNVSARRLASDRSFVIGLVVHKTSEYHGEIITNILEEVNKLRYSLQVIYHDPKSHASRASINGIIQQKCVDGLILTPPCDNDLIFLHMCAAAAIPFVRLTPMDPNLPFPYVTGDDYQGAYDLTKYLIELGHKRIGFLMGNHEHQASQARFEGYLAAMRELGLVIDTDMIRDANFEFESGRQQTHELLKNHNSPSAVIASNDESAAGALYAAHEARILVPEELSIAGIDDLPTAHKVWPALTTVRQPMERISREATNMLIALIEGKAPEITQIRVEEELVVRQSTGSCAR